MKDPLVSCALQWSSKMLALAAGGGEPVVGENRSRQSPLNAFQSQCLTSLKNGNNQVNYFSHFRYQNHLAQASCVPLQNILQRGNHGSLLPASQLTTDTAWPTLLRMLATEEPWISVDHPLLMLASYAAGAECPARRGILLCGARRRGAYLPLFYRLSASAVDALPAALSRRPFRRRSPATGSNDRHDAPFSRRFLTSGQRYMNTFTSPRIDPRTGLIRFHLPLLHLIGNDHIGPALSLMLNYFPLETERSLYVRVSAILCRDSIPRPGSCKPPGGERLGLNRQDGEWAFLPPFPLHIKLATRQDSLWIYYQNGAIEIVSRSPHQPAGDLLWRLQTRLSAGGNVLTLSWGWRQNLALLISVADDDGELMRASLRLTPPGGKKARARVDAEAGSPAQAEFITEVEANARTAGNTRVSNPMQASANAQAGTNPDAKADTDETINAELVYTCFPASHASVTTIVTVAGGRVVQLSIGPAGLCCIIGNHAVLACPFW